MTIIKLLDELCEFTMIALKDIELLTEDTDTDKGVTVYQGFLPESVDKDIKTIEEEFAEKHEIVSDDKLVPKFQKAKSHFPYVLLRFIEEKDKFLESDEVSIRAIIGTYDPEGYMGWKDVVNIGTRLKHELKKHKNHVSFLLKDEIVFTLFEQQNYPFFYGVVDMKFDIPQTQPELTDEDFNF